MGIEIERKFLVDHKKWGEVAKPTGTYYRQGYVMNEPDRILRVRVAGAKAFITIKGGNSGISRKEFEYEIPVTDGIELLDNFAISEVEKTRYCLHFAGKLWEIDEFHGDNSGLITAEIELQQEDETFELPAWIAAEVSTDARYYNSNLSVKPFKNW